MISALIFPTLVWASVVATHARVFAPRPGARVTAGYVTLTNEGKAKVEVKIESVEGFAAAELHESFEKDGHAGMRRLASVPIPAGGKVEFQPGANHMMLFDPRAGLKAGDTVKAIFLVNGKPQSVLFPVVAREGEGP